jgi:uncharacterized protein GlcG (DUF336 family)
MRDSKVQRGFLPRARFCLAMASAIVVVGCGSGSQVTTPGSTSAVSPDNVTNCLGNCATANTFLTVTDVQNVIARAVAEAQARNVNATIAVTDRVGNVLAVFAMNGAPPSVTVGVTALGTPIVGGLEGVNIIPSSLAAIAKAVTGSYLSSEGNAFSTRTASQIVQSHFNPGELLTPSGPLSGVQFSSLPCSDLNSRFVAGGGTVPGPLRSPLGLSADPGGFPLYKGGTPVGGVGVSADGVYALDPMIMDIDSDLDEAIALAATFGLAAPVNRRADQLTADGKQFRFSDVTFDQLQAPTATPPSFTSIAGNGQLLSVAGYTDGTAILQGTAFGTPPSGYRPDALDYPGQDAFVLVDAGNNERFRPRAGTEASGALSAAEVQAIMNSALSVANRARAQIRQPLGTAARVTISVVDSNGVILAIARTRDAPIFGTDVSLQKARTAAFFSTATAASNLTNLPPAVYLNQGLVVLQNSPLGPYVTALQTSMGVPTALTDGQIAFTSRAIGAVARPFLPDGVDMNGAGPLAKPAGQWSVFNTGVQLDLIYNAVVQHVGFVLTAGTTTPLPDVGQNCTGNTGLSGGFTLSNQLTSIANGFQIFPGSAPIYRGQQLVGAVGVSGDGVDQDDMVAFLGIQGAATTMASFSQAPSNMRADQFTAGNGGTKLRYISCPQSPFVNSDAEGVCNGF